jgi:hypothetical protein
MEAEMKRLGQFERIYPTPNSNIYKNFFDDERPLNTLALNWINGNVRKELATSTSRGQLPPRTGKKRTGSRRR